MNTPRPRSLVTLSNRTGLAWREFNSLPPTPPPEAAAAPGDDTPVVDTSGLNYLDDVTPVVPPRVSSAPPAETSAAATPVVLPPVANPISFGKGKALVLIAGGLALGALVGLLVYFPAKPKERPRPIPVAPKDTAPPPATAPPTVTALTVPSEVVQPALPSIPTEAPLPSKAKSHIEITVQPAAAVLSLDEHVAGGNLIKMDISPSRTPHVVHASASGYITFKKTISYAKDVFLDIKLEKTQPLARAVARDRPAPQIEAEPRGNDLNLGAQGRPRGAPSSAEGEDFGMDLERPTPKRPTKRMDETDPYSP